METSAFRALARHLKATLSSSSLPPLFSPLRRRPSKTLLPLALPGCRLSSAASLLRSAAGDRLARLFSSISSDQDLELREGKESPSSRSAEDEYKDPLLQAQQEKQSRFVPVKAYFLCTSIDLRSLQAQNATNVIPPSSRATNYVVLRYYDVKNGPQGYLKIVEKNASGLLPEMRKDDYAVVVKPNLETWMQGGVDYIALKSLDIDGVRTIGSVLGQSIALDYYIRQVDGMVAEFTDINRGLEKTGTFTMKRRKLFQLVGKANSNLADVILKLGLFERSDIAWKNANYAQIWEYLRDEYELTQRFGNLDFKLKFVEHNIRFLQDILQNRTSVFLEGLIILLITVAILISVYNVFCHPTPRILQPKAGTPKIVEGSAYYSN
ncbi:protein RETARDED ROOT GROWTH-LIKE isoform X2 [Musa acuminata AAA Group]|uniref:protein RETARDED ROOT GROWTH-LIKE isoform X2 n=1 Tax=Musa acuminata AAA Group TaxID=214697 RepID=UPI0031DAF199